MDNVINITNDNFEKEVLASSIPVFLDFWSSDCGPCKMMLPMIEELANDYAGRVKFASVNVEKEDNVIEHHFITSVPTFVVYKDGKIILRKSGAIQKDHLEKLFTSVL